MQTSRRFLRVRIGTVGLALAAIVTGRRLFVFVFVSFLAFPFAVSFAENSSLLGKWDAIFPGGTAKLTITDVTTSGELKGTYHYKSGVGLGSVIYQLADTISAAEMLAEFSEGKIRMQTPGGAKFTLTPSKTKLEGIAKLANGVVLPVTFNKE